MLRKFSNSRTLEDNIKLGVLTAFSGGMVNVASLLIFFSFSSNVTGHYAILASEIVKGNLYQTAIVFSWIFLFFFGSFFSNLIVIHLSRVNTYLAHSIPLVLEIICLLSVGFYGQFYYRETLIETEILLGVMLFAMGLQNGLTASISNFAVKTTHLTGTTTDLGILFSMFTKREYRENKELRGKAKLLSAIATAYLGGAIVSGFLYFYTGFQVFYLVSIFLTIVIFYDWYKIRFSRFLALKRRNNYIKVNTEKTVIKPSLNLNSFTENKRKHLQEETV
ncbi:MAG TPA: YoaK family protein [Flavobacterium sp.]|uniref:YoaK family protein n=2 Tax=Flavobacterium TaxID=237 RepID=UPI0025B9F1E2|nr:MULTISPECIES: YoaK family protein [unclassified Flavobacterium]HRE78225.1 YoaK family protein [Flavobacterium sp.]